MLWDAPPAWRIAFQANKPGERERTHSFRSMLLILGLLPQVYSRVLAMLASSAPSAVAGGGAGGAAGPGVTPLSHVAVAGAVAGVALSFILGPTELVKVSGADVGTSHINYGGNVALPR